MLNPICLKAEKMGMWGRSELTVTKVSTRKVVQISTFKLSKNNMKQWNNSTVQWQGRSQSEGRQQKWGFDFLRKKHWHLNTRTAETSWPGPAPIFCVKKNTESIYTTTKTKTLKLDFILQARLESSKILMSPDAVTPDIVLCTMIVERCAEDRRSLDCTGTEDTSSRTETSGTHTEWQSEHLYTSHHWNIKCENVPIFIRDVRWYQPISLTDISIIMYYR